MWIRIRIRFWIGFSFNDLRIMICIQIPDPGSKFVFRIFIPDPDPWAKMTC
jgi:hypothetical protein